MTSERDRALKLLEQEDRRSEEIAARRAEQESEGRLKDAIQRVKEQDREARKEQARAEAESRAAEIVRERHELEERIEQEAMQLARSLRELEALHQRHASALREAGQSTEGHRLPDLVAPWWKDRFGGPASITGTPAGHMDSLGHYQERMRKSLAERDSLASGQTK